jgi:predicted permease
VWLSTTLEAVVKDIRYAWRGLRRSPVFTTVAVLTLAICIGANTAIFTVMHRVLLAPLPYPDGNRIVRLDTNPASDPNLQGLGLYSEVVRAWAARSRTVEHLVASNSNLARVGVDSTSPRVPAAWVTPSFLTLLRTPPVLGRGFTAGDARSGAPGVAMIGYAYWQTHYGSATDVVGKAITIDGVPRTIIGVTASHVQMPTAFQERTDVWMPLHLDSAGGVLDVVARLRPGVTPDVASRELDAIMHEAASDTTWARSSRASARRAQDLVDARQRRAIALMFVAVCGLLAVACANIANLLLMRAWTRRRELAVRRALGAGRLRLARQLLTESLTLAVLGGALGAVIGWQGLRAIVALSPRGPGDHSGLPDQLDATVLLWTAGVSVATGLLFGVGPALLSGGRSMGDALRIGAQSAIGSSTARRLRSGLVVAEIALSMVFLVAAGLLVRSFIALEGTSVGYDPTGLVSVAVDLTSRPAQGDRASAEQSLLRALRGVPGVRDAALGMVPQNNVGEGPFAIETPAGVQPLDIQILMVDFVGPDYFRVVGLPLVLGRTFESTGSTPTAADEIIVNQAVARRIWGERSAVGARLRIGEGSSAKWLTVVGVSADVRLPGKTGDFYTVQMYRPTTAADEVVSTVVLRVNTRNARVLERSVEQAIKAAGLSGTIARVVWAESMLDAVLLARPRFALVLFGVFAAIALVLAALGLYGVIAYGVAQRSREIGLRVALGADARSVARLILGGSLRLVALGSGIGIIGAYAATRLLAAFLFETSPTDPVSFGAAVLLLGAVALLASFIPMRRAVRVDPMHTLRTD